MKLAAHEDFLQLERQSWDREGGLHGVLQSCFPIDGRDEQGNGALLEQRGYELLVAGEGEWTLYIALRLSRWTAAAIVHVAEQSFMICMLTSDGSLHPYPSRMVALEASADEFAGHVGSLIFDAAARGKERMVAIAADTSPADMIDFVG